MKTKYEDLQHGQHLFICDLRIGEYRDPFDKPIRNVKPTEVMFFGRYCDGTPHFRPLKKDGKASAKKISIWDTTGHRSNGVPVQMFTTMDEATACYAEQRQAVIDAIIEKRDGLQREADRLIAEL